MPGERFFQGAYWDNLGISYSAGTFTIHGWDGRALSTSNPGVVVLPSKASYGLFVRYSVTANQSFIDDAGASEIIGNTFGTTAGTAWGNILPMFIYAVGNDAETTIQFMLCRVPHNLISPVVANIGAPDDAVANTTGSFWSFDNIDETLFDQNPCMCIGSIIMTKSAADDWTVNSPSIYEQGIGKFSGGSTFTLPNLQNGATASTLSSSVGGNTIPTFDSTGNVYQITPDGLCIYYFNWANITVNGVGAGLLRFHLPYSTSNGVSWYTNGALKYRNSGAGTYNTGFPTNYDKVYYFEIVMNGIGTNKLTPADLTTDKTEGSFCVIYRADTVN